MKRLLTSALLSLAALGMASPALAQAWPAKPVTLLVPFPPGGSVDQVARILQVPLQQHLGQTVVVENRGGASGAIGTASVLNAPADGYTFAVVFDTHGVNPSLMPQLPYDTKRDIATVAVVGTGATGIQVIQTIAPEVGSMKVFVRTPQYALLTAGWFWSTHNCNNLAATKDWIGLTKKINGGTIGLDDRVSHTKLAIAVIDVGDFSSTMA